MFYWPRITFATLGDVQAGAVTTTATTGKIMLLISGADTIVHHLKISDTF